MGLTIKNGYLITYCRFKPIDHDRYESMNIKTEDEYDVIRVKIDSVIGWNQADDAEHTTLRLISGESFTITENINDIDKYFLDEQHN